MSMNFSKVKSIESTNRFKAFLSVTGKSVHKHTVRLNLPCFKVIQTQIKIGHFWPIFVTVDFHVRLFRVLLSSQMTSYTDTQ